MACPAPKPRPNPAAIGAPERTASVLGPPLRSGAFCSLVALLIDGAAHAYPLKEASVGVTNYATPARQALATGDFDNDGAVEISLATAGPAPLMVLLEQSGQRWRPGRVLPLSLEKTMRLLPWQDNNATRLVGIESPGDTSPDPAMVQIFGGQPLAVVAQFPVINEIRGVAIGDSDLDGAAEILLAGWTATRAYELNTGNLKWTLPYGSESLVIANVDLDVAPEIIIGGDQTTIIDGFTLGVEWSYGYSRYVAVGRIGSGGAARIVSSDDSGTLSIFRGVPWALDWQLQRPSIHALAVADLDGDLVDEIVQADGDFGTVNTIDVATRQIRASIATPGSGVGNLVIADVAGGARPEILFTRQFFGGSNAPQYVAMRIASGVTQTPVFDLNTDSGGLGAVAIGDVDNDGEIEFILGANDTLYGRIRVVDGQTGDDEWVSPGVINNANNPFFITPRFIFSVQLDADPALEIVVAGKSGSDGRVIVLDGATRDVQLQIGDFQGNRLIADRGVLGAELFDYDADGHPDLVLGTAAQNTGATGAQLFVVSLQTGQLLWQSPTIGTGYSGSAFVVPAAGAGQQAYLVAVVPEGLLAYGAASRVLEWSYTGPVGVATYFGQASGGPQIVLADDSGNMLHLDAATRSVLRNYSLPAPVSLIAAMPGEARLLVRSARSFLSLYDNGEVAGQTPLDNMYPFQGSVAVASTGAQSIVLAGTPYGYVRYENDRDGVFVGGFE